MSESLGAATAAIAEDKIDDIMDVSVLHTASA